MPLKFTVGIYDGRFIRFWDVFFIQKSHKVRLIKKFYQVVGLGAGKIHIDLLRIKLLGIVCIIAFLFG